MNPCGLGGTSLEVISSISSTESTAPRESSGTEARQPSVSADFRKDHLLGSSRIYCFHKSIHEEADRVGFIDQRTRQPFAENQTSLPGHFLPTPYVKESV